ALPPFFLALGTPRAPTAPRLAARALLADPLLLAAVDWERSPGLLDAALVVAEEWPGIDAGYRAALVRQDASLLTGGPVGRLSVDADSVPATAMSLYAFRRLPWPATLATVPV